VSKSRHKGSAAASIRSPAVAEEKMLFVPFSALTLMVGWHEGHLAHKKIKNPLISGGCVLEQMEEED